MMNSTPRAITVHVVGRVSVGDRDAEGDEAEVGTAHTSGEEVIAHSEKGAMPTAFITQEDPL